MKKRVHFFFIGAFATLFAVSTVYSLLSWIITGHTEGSFWIAPAFSGMFLAKELYDYRTCTE